MPDPTSRTSPRSPLPLRRRIAFFSVAVLVGIFVTALLVEIGIRVISPTPRVPIVRASTRSYRIVDGVPVWSAPAERGEPCSVRRPGDRRVAFFGSSITYGVEVDDAHVFTTLLEQRLDGVCVDNRGVPGFGQEQQFIAADEWIEEQSPTLVVWELWNPVKHYTLIGGDAFMLRDVATDRQGFPESDLPPSIEHTLFPFSRAVQYATLALVPPMQPVPGPLEPTTARVCSELLPRLVATLAEHHAPLLIWVPPNLDRPFDQQGRAGEDEAAIACARELGVAPIVFADVVQGQDNARIRLDSCHFNPTGHALLADFFAPQLRELVRTSVAP